MDRSRNGRSAITRRRSASDATGPSRAQRARQRAFCVAALPTRRRPRRARRAAAHGRRGRRRRDGPAARAAAPEHLPRARQGGRGEGGRAGVRREPDRLRRRADRAPGAQPRGGDRPAGGGSHDGDPRHLRLARGQRRGQAPGRAGPARVQPRAHARAVEPPRAPRRRDRHAGGPGRRRSRPTAAWRATASRRCAGAWST